ncbi:MAG: hypothetical protein WCI89_03125 [bacterium]
MTEILIIVGALLGLCVFFVSVYVLVSHPTGIDEEEVALVQHETPEEHVRALHAEHQKTDQEENQENVELYGPEL